ncbi:hypothetical protein RVH17_08125 [Alistipes finegoldii]|uniref:Uncharacterized protein n=1 Tax=Alistipes finegoldii TaxID=214856 RepID=A0AAE4LLV0_9BACT|nr:hypothetical protein [Alistipes finegoldii]MDU0260078.1 hypothetical protein [Alistipes finegoldii]
MPVLLPRYAGRRTCGLYARTVRQLRLCGRKGQCGDFAPFRRGEALFGRCRRGELQQCQLRTGGLQRQ